MSIGKFSTTFEEGVHKVFRTSDHSEAFALCDNADAAHKIIDALNHSCEEQLDRDEIIKDLFKLA